MNYFVPPIFQQIFAFSLRYTSGAQNMSPRPKACHMILPDYIPLIPTQFVTKRYTYLKVSLHAVLPGSFSKSYFSEMFLQVRNQVWHGGQNDNKKNELEAPAAFFEAGLLSTERMDILHNWILRWMNPQLNPTNPTSH